MQVTTIGLIGLDIAKNVFQVGAIQSDAALRQSMEPRQMAAATLSDGALLLAIL
jgi:hypothetical protein